jgi:hypothetical protein
LTLNDLYITWYKTDRALAGFSWIQTHFDMEAVFNIPTCQKAAQIIPSPDSMQSRMELLRFPMLHQMVKMTNL